MAKIFPHTFQYQNTCFKSLVSIGKINKVNYYHVQVFDEQMIAILGNAHIRYTKTESKKIVEQGDDAKRELLHVIVAEIDRATAGRRSRAA
jgi:predicted metal-binding transcription factor (methanogenesis marker protein 9)